MRLRRVEKVSWFIFGRNRTVAVRCFFAELNFDTGAAALVRENIGQGSFIHSLSLGPDRNQLRPWRLSLLTMLATWFPAPAPTRWQLRHRPNQKSIRVAGPDQMYDFVKIGTAWLGRQP